jgi:TonB family protein
MLQLLKYSATLISLSLLVSPPARTQQNAPPDIPATPSFQTDLSPSYPDTPEGLKQLLWDVVAAQKSRNADEIAAAKQDLEIPNYEEWFTETFGAEQGQKWADAYRFSLEKSGRGRGRFYLQLIDGDGEIVTRKVNDAPAPGVDLERQMLASMKQPVDIYFVGWTFDGAPHGSQPAPVGYFMFIDGKFRWDNALTLADLQPRETSSPLDVGPNLTPSQLQNPTSVSASPTPVPEAYAGPFIPGVLGVGFPSCIYCPRPSFSAEAQASSGQGSVTLAVTVQPDGHGTDVKVVQSVGFNVDEQATQAVENWRFNPALDSDGTPVPVVTEIETSYRFRGSPMLGGAGGTEQPVCTYCPDPKYSDEARRAKLEGSVVLRFVVKPDGSTTNISVVKSLGMGLDEKAIEAVQTWRFKPAIGPDGTPVAAFIGVSLNFHIR